MKEIFDHKKPDNDDWIRPMRNIKQERFDS